MAAEEAIAPARHRKWGGPLLFGWSVVQEYHYEVYSWYASDYYAGNYPHYY